MSAAVPEMSAAVPDVDANAPAEARAEATCAAAAGGDVNVASTLLEALHADAVRTSAANRSKLHDSIREQERRRAEEMRHTIQLATRAQDRILQDVKAGLRDKVMQAAGGGLRSANILEFNGSDQYAADDGTSSLLYVFLVLGPRPHEHKERRYMQEFGYRPLLARLRDELGHLFVVKHYHTRSTNVNQIRIMWSDEKRPRNGRFSAGR